MTIDQGQVAEVGTHHELVGRDGVYASLIASQRAGILAEGAVDARSSP